MSGTHSARELFAHFDPPGDVSLTRSMKPISAIEITPPPSSTSSATYSFDRRRNSTVHAARPNSTLKRIPSSPSLQTGGSVSANDSPIKKKSTGPGRSLSRDSAATGGLPPPSAGFLRSLLPGFLAPSVSLPNSPRSGRGGRGGGGEGGAGGGERGCGDGGSKSDTFAAVPRVSTFSGAFTSSPVNIRQSASHTGRSRTYSHDATNIAADGSEARLMLDGDDLVDKKSKDGLSSRGDEGTASGFVFPDQAEEEVVLPRGEQRDSSSSSTSTIEDEKEKEANEAKKRQAEMERLRLDLVELEMPYRVILRTDAFPHLFNRGQENENILVQRKASREMQGPTKKRSGGLFKGWLAEPQNKAKGKGKVQAAKGKRYNTTSRNTRSSGSDQESSSSSTSSSPSSDSMMTKAAVIPPDIEILVVVALGKTKKHIQEHWEWLNQQLIPSLDDFDIGIEGQSGLQEETALYQYLLMKISGLATEEDLSRIDRGNKQLEMTKGVILEKMRKLDEKSMKIEKSTSSSSTSSSLTLTTSDHGNSAAAEKNSKKSQQRKMKKMGRPTKRSTRSEIFDGRKRSLPGHSRLAATEENKQVLFKSLVESMGMVWADELAALVACTF